MTNLTLHFCRKGAVSVIFATAIVPLLMIVGLAVDYGFYNEAEAQLEMAADAAAIHAARIASELEQKYGFGSVAQDQQLGQLAGQKWFLDQLGIVPQSKSINPPTVVVNFDPTGKNVTATVNYSGVIRANFGNLFPKNIPTWPNWSIGGQAVAVISIPSFVEIDMLLDNSSSMLIAADPANIEKMEALTPCSQQALNEGQPIDLDYSWAYAQTAGGWIAGPQGNPVSSTLSTTPATYNKNIYVPYGYGVFIYPATSGASASQADILPPVNQVGQCDQTFVSAANQPGAGNPALECEYPGTLLQTKLLPAGTTISPTGQCLYNGAVSGGGPGAKLYYNSNTGLATPANLVIPQNMPQAPCAFACHTSQTNDDYWGLAQANGVTTRYEVLHQAASDVISTMSNAPGANQLLTVGVYEFNAPGTSGPTDPGVSKVYPQPPSLQEAGNDWATATSITKSIQPPVTQDGPDTSFEDAMSYLYTNLGNAGAGDNAATPQKNLFIVTDGVDDYPPGPARQQRAFSAAACQELKNKGFTIYVLYTPYYPVPNPYYLQKDLGLTEEVNGNSSPIETAMQACANLPTAPYYIKANDQPSINKALQDMLANVLGSPGRLSN